MFTDIFLFHCVSYFPFISGVAIVCEWDNAMMISFVGINALWPNVSSKHSVCLLTFSLYESFSYLAVRS